MLTNADMTIYNKVFDKVTRTDKFVRTQVQKVNWYNNLGAVMSNGAVGVGNTFKLRTENYGSYLPEKDYKALATKTGKWTIQRDDVVAKGLLTTEITGIADLQKLGIECFRVTTYSDNRRGGLPHLRLGGE